MTRIYADVPARYSEVRKVLEYLSKRATKGDVEIDYVFRWHEDCMIGAKLLKAGELESILKNLRRVSNGRGRIVAA